MARGRNQKSTPPARRRALVASGTNIRVDDQAAMVRYRRRSARQIWQDKAWLFNDEVPEIGFAHDYVRDALSRVRIFPAILSDDPDAPPVPLNDETTPDGLDPELADSILRRLEPYPEFMGETAHKLDVAGEAHIALYADDDAFDGERCQVLSNDELRVNGDEWAIIRDEGDQTGLALPSDSVLFRIHQRWGRYGDLPTSHMRRLLGVCEALLLLTDLVEAVAHSRIAIAGGLLYVPWEMTLENAEPDDKAETTDAGDGEGQSDRFIDDFLTAAATAIQDPTKASALIRMIIRGPANMADKIKAIDLDRQFEETLIKLPEMLLGRIGNGINLPREIVLGVGSTNHWNDESIREDTWKVHLEPRAMNITNATTEAFYRPQLLANDIDPEIVRRCVIGYDPEWYIGTPDQSESADEGFNNYALSWKAWRGAKGWSEDDAPTEDEIKYRIWIRQQEKITVRETAQLPPGEQVGQVLPADAAALDGSTPTDGSATVAVPSAQDKTAPAEPVVASVYGHSEIVMDDALVAAASQHALDALGGRLVGIERDLRTRLQQIANQIVARALERAGMKVRTTVGRGVGKEQGVGTSIRSKDARRRRELVLLMEDVPLAEIPALIGRTALESFGLKEDALLTGALGDLEAQYRKLVTRAQHAAARAAAQATGDTFDEDTFDEQMAGHRDAGWLLFSAGITALVTSLLYNPHPAAPTVGEFDDTSVVQPQLVRAALDAAGGVNVDAQAAVDGARTIPIVQVGDARPAGAGATAGPAVLDEFKAQLGIVDDKYVWVYGDAPRRTFTPHLALDGIEFEQRDDPRLANSDDGLGGASFLDVDFYQPQDHAGCLCDVSVSFTQAVVASIPKG